MKNQKYNILILVFATLLVVYFVMKDDFSNIINAISKVNVGWVLFSFGLVLVYWFFQTLCLSVIASTTDYKLSFKEKFKSMILCNFFSAITPSATGGQPFQVYYLNKAGVDLGTATNLVVGQSTLYQIALVIMALVAIGLNYFFDFFPSDILLKKLVIIGLAINIIVIGFLIFVSFGRKSNKFLASKLIAFLHKIKIIRNKEKTLSKMKDVMDNFYTSTSNLINNKAILVQGVMYNFIALAFFYIIPITVLYSLGDYSSLDIMTTLVASAYVMLIGVFVPIPGGSGGIEFAFASFFGFYITGSALMAMLLIWRFITYYLTILIGGLVLIISRRNV